MSDVSERSAGEGRQERSPGKGGAADGQAIRSHLRRLPFMSKRILIVLSEWGYWGEELLGPLETFDKAGYEVDFATPTGKRPPAITVSMDPDYVDPPLGRSVTTPEVAEKVRALDASSRVDAPLRLGNLM